MTIESNIASGEMEARRTCLGRYASRTAFGDEVLREAWDAEARLLQLPVWLRPYVRFDGAAVARDLEADGVYEFVPIDDATSDLMVYYAEGV